MQVYPVIWSYSGDLTAADYAAMYLRTEQVLLQWVAS